MQSHTEAGTSVSVSKMNSDASGSLGTQNGQHRCRQRITSAAEDVPCLPELTEIRVLL